MIISHPTQLFSFPENNYTTIVRPRKKGPSLSMRGGKVPSHVWVVRLYLALPNILILLVDI